MPELLTPSADLPVFRVLFWSVRAHAWRLTTYPPRSRRDAVRLRSAMAADRPDMLYRVAMV
jgi:hypothetical protein